MGEASIGTVVSIVDPDTSNEPESIVLAPIPLARVEGWYRLPFEGESGLAISARGRLRVEGKLVVSSKQAFVRVGYVPLSLFPCSPSWVGLVEAEKDSLWLPITDRFGSQSLPAEFVFMADVAWR